MRDIVKWVVNNKQNELKADEQVLAAVGVAPKGAIARRLKGAIVAGGVGVILAENESKKGHTQNILPPSTEKFPKGNVYIALTDSRLLVYKVSTFMGRPKELLGQYDRSELGNMDANKSKYGYEITLTFSDGGAIVLEADRHQKQSVENFVKCANSKL